MQPTERISTPIHAIYSELHSLAVSDTLTKISHSPGSFRKRTIRGNDYWYFKYVQDGQVQEKIIGRSSPDLDLAIEQSKAQIQDHRNRLDHRRALVRSLVGAGVTAPDPLSGKVMAALADADVFRLGGILIGTHAFRSYGPVLGVHIPDAAGVTGDIDVASNPVIPIAVDERTVPIGDILKGIDARFEPDVNMGQGKVHRWVLRTKTAEFKVEMLAPMFGPENKNLIPAPIFQSSAMPLRYLDYVMQDAINATIVNDAGIPVLVPDPARYALHKLIVAAIRDKAMRDKIRKDISQSEYLLNILLSDNPGATHEAFMDLLDRGPAWRKLAATSCAALSDPIKGHLLKWAADHYDFVNRVNLLSPPEPTRHSL
jgi:hypothetical protein